MCLIVTWPAWVAPVVCAAEPVRLTRDGMLKRDPRWTRGGQELVYCVDEGVALIRMMRLNLESKTARPVFEDAGNKHQIEAAFSPDGRFMAFTECTGNLTARLVIRELETRKDAEVVYGGGFGGTCGPAFSPDSRRVIYPFAESGPQQLWSVALDGKDRKQITQCEGVSNWPSFTPDGKTIVFANSRENNYEIYRINADGTGEVRLTRNSCLDVHPTVSPDGKRIAFASTRDGNWEIYVMNLDGSDVQRVTRHEERDDFPAWHPNGRQLAIVAERDGKSDLHVVDVPDPTAAAPIDPARAVARGGSAP